MPTKLPRCFFTINIDGMPLGTVIFELCADICPKTCENFMCLCTGEKGHGTQGKLLSYKGSSFHRIVKNFMIQGGDFTHGTGVGGESIFGGVFPDENFILKHDQKYLLSMANRGPNTNGSQFFITTAVCPHLDNSHVVFGHVVEGERYLDQIEMTAVDTDHKPFADIRIVDCGLVPGYEEEKAAQPVPEQTPITVPMPPVPAAPVAVPPVAAVAPTNTIPLLQDAAETQAEPVKEEKKKKKKKKKSSSDDSDSSSSDGDSSDSSDSDEDSSDSDSGNKKLKKKKKKLLRIKKKLDKIAKKKKLKKSRAKKLKRVEEKLKKIDKILTGQKLSSESDSEKEETKKSFLYRSSVSPPKKKKMKKEKPPKKEDKILDDAFFAKRGKIAGAFMAPISQLHGLGVEEFSQTGPTDHITAIVNRTKTNVGPGVGGLEKAKKLGVNKVIIPTQKSGNIVVNPANDKKAAAKSAKKKAQKKKASKKAESSSDDSSAESSSESESESSEEEKKPKKKKKKSVQKQEEEEEVKVKRSSSKVSSTSKVSTSKVSKKKEATPVKKKASPKPKAKSVSKSPTVSRSPSRSKSVSKSRSRSPIRREKKHRGSDRVRRDSGRRDRKKRSRSRSRSRNRSRDKRSSRRRSRSSSRRRDGGRSRRRSRSTSSSGSDDDSKYSGMAKSRGRGYHNSNRRGSRGRGNYNNSNFRERKWDPNYKQNRPRLYNSNSGFAPRSVWDKNRQDDQGRDKSPVGKMRSDEIEKQNADKRKDDKNTTSYMDDVEDRQPVKPKGDDGVEISWNKYKSLRLAHTGMRSKWSEDEEDTVKITTGKDNENGKALGKNIKSDSQDFPYPNAVDSKDGKGDNLLSEYNSPKINFS